MGTRSVGSHMRRHWLAAAPDAGVTETLQLARVARMREIPVVADGILRGTVSFAALVEAALRNPSARVRDLMRPELEAGDPTMSLAEAAGRIARARTGCLPIVERGPEGPRMVGLVTESDLLRLAYDAARGSTPA